MVWGDDTYLHCICHHWDKYDGFSSPSNVRSIRSERKSEGWAVVVQNLLTCHYDSIIFHFIGDCWHYLWKTCLLSSFCCKGKWPFDCFIETHDESKFIYIFLFFFLNVNRCSVDSASLLSSWTNHFMKQLRISESINERDGI